MKAKLNKSILAAAIMGAMFHTNAAMANEGCEDSFGPWCNIANFLEQQEPTAAGGPLFGSNPSFSSTSFNSNEFGGSVTQNTESNIQNEFVGNVLITENGQAFIADVNLVEDQETEQVFVEIKVGETAINLTLDEYERISKESAGFSNKTSINVVASGENTFTTGTDTQQPTEIDNVVIDSETLTVFSKVNLNNGVDEFQDDAFWDDDVAFGTVYIGSYNAPPKSRAETSDSQIERKIAPYKGFVGKPTALTAINSLQGETSYYIYGVSNFKNITKYSQRDNTADFRTGNIYGNINVDFTNSTFNSTQTHVDYVTNDSSKIRPTITVTNGKIINNTFLTDNDSTISVVHNKTNKGPAPHTFLEGSVSGTFTGSQAQGLVGKTQVQYQRGTGDIKEINAVYSGTKAIGLSD